MVGKPSGFAAEDEDAAVLSEEWDAPRSDDSRMVGSSLVCMADTGKSTIGSDQNQQQGQ